MGYYHGKTYFAGLRKAGQLWFMAPPTRRASLEQLAPSGVARFTDLAEMVCRVRQATPERLGEGEEWEEEEEESEPNSSDILTDPEDFLGEDESGFLSQVFV